MNYVQLQPRLGAGKALAQALAMPTIAQPVPQKTDLPNKPIDMVPEKKKKWYWRPVEDLETTIESLSWIDTNTDPDGNKLSETQFNKSYKNMVLWLEDTFDEIIKEHNDRINKEMLG